MRGVLVPLLQCKTTKVLLPQLPARHSSLPPLSHRPLDALTSSPPLHLPPMRSQAHLLIDACPSPRPLLRSSLAMRPRDHPQAMIQLSLARLGVPGQSRSFDRPQLPRKMRYRRHNRPSTRCIRHHRYEITRFRSSRQILLRRLPLQIMLLMPRCDRIGAIPLRRREK